MRWRDMPIGSGVTVLDETNLTAIFTRAEICHFSRQNGIIERISNSRGFMNNFCSAELTTCASYHCSAINHELRYATRLIARDSRASEKIGSVSNPLLKRRRIRAARSTANPPTKVWDFEKTDSKWKYDCFKVWHVMYRLEPNLLARAKVRYFSSRELSSENIFSKFVECLIHVVQHSNYLWLTWNVIKLIA